MTTAEAPRMMRFLLRERLFLVRESLLSEGGGGGGMAGFRLKLLLGESDIMAGQSLFSGVSEVSYRMHAAFSLQMNIQ